MAFATYFVLLGGGGGGIVLICCSSVWRIRFIFKLSAAFLGTLASFGLARLLRDTFQARECMN